MADRPTVEEPAKLAVDLYASLELGDTAGTLDLAWTSDERQVLAADLDAVIKAELAAERQEGLPYLHQYLVRDPYAEALLRPAVASFFGLPPGGWRVSSGAGVGPTLASLSTLAGTAGIIVLGHAYPDLAAWAQRVAPRAPIAAGNVDELSMGSAGVVFLERPSLLDDGLRSLDDLDDLVALAARARGGGGVVVVDESNANYWPPSYSAVNAVPFTDNLAVLRGFSKAYQLGGLRLSYVVASNAATELVRRALPPLLCSTLALRIGRAVLELGDVTQPLRARIAANKPDFERLVQRVTGAATVPPTEHLPYVFLPHRHQVVAAIRNRSVLGKPHVVWAPGTSGTRTLYRLSTPLTDERMVRARQLLA